MMLAARSPSAYWYFMRGSGVVSLLLLTLIVLLGVATSLNWSIPKLPRFVVQDLHRNVALAALIFLTLHVVLAIADTYVTIGIKDVFIPFVSQYRPLWVGLGTLAIDLIIVLVVTSLLREYIGLRAWKILHWVAYLCWPLAVVHALVLGSDTSRAWLLALYAIEAVTIVALLLIRVGSNAEPGPEERFRRQAVSRRAS